MFVTKSTKSYNMMAAACKSEIAHVQRPLINFLLNLRVHVLSHES